MIVVDTSALIAIFAAEPESGRFDALIRQTAHVYISAVSVHETGIVMRMRHGDHAVTEVWRYLRQQNDFIIAPFDAAQAEAALAAHRVYGKGVHAKARLNMGDCAAYALAKTMDLPLLFKGGDFAATDLTACIQL